MIDAKSYCLAQMKALMDIPSPTGMTGAAADYVVNELKAMGFEPVKMRKGTVLCCLGGEGNPLLTSAHVDTLGAVVRAVKPNGRLRYHKIGGWNDNALENENVTIHTRDGKKTFTGTIQSVHASRHVWRDTTAEQRSDQTLEIVIDEITNSKAETEALGISAGDMVCFDPRFVVTESGFIKSRFLDDKAAAAVLLTLAKQVSEGEVTLSRKVTIGFTVYEELGHGASTFYSQDACDMIAVDMGCVGADLGGDETKLSICAADSAGTYDWDLTNSLIAAAKELNIDFAVDTYPGYSSDTATALKAGLDARFALIGPGVFASHGYERTHIKSVMATLALLTKMC